MGPTIFSEKIPLNGVSQWVYLSKIGPSYPTLLFLHGGPGWADAPLAHLICRGLENRFNLLHWDQRGCNRSFDPKADPRLVNTEHLLSDAESLLQWLQADHGLSRVIVVGHSWGSLLGVKLLEKTSRIEAYVGIGQYVSADLGEPRSLRFCHDQARDLRRKDWAKALESIPADFYKHLDLLFKQREIVSVAGGEFKKPVTEEQFKKWLAESPPNYRSTWELMYQTCLSSCQTLWPELLATDFSKTGREFAVPVLILQGKDDQCTNCAVAKDWFETIRAPRKEFVTFDHSAHWPQLEEQTTFAKIINQRFA